MSDVEIGLKTIKYFWTWNRSFNGSTFKLSFEEFQKALAPNPTKLNIILDGIGGGVREAGVSDSRIEAAMRSLALASKGKVPSNYQVFFKYLINEATQVSWIDAIVYTVVESGKDVIGAAQDVGDSLIFTGKILNFLLPAVALIFVFIWLNKQSSGEFGKILKGLKK